MPLVEPTGGRLSERIHPGFPADWRGSPFEWHQRLMLYFDALEVEKELARLQTVVADVPALQQELDEIEFHIQRLSGMQSTAPRTRGGGLTEKYTGEISG